jgi:hypothetical protein
MAARIAHIRQTEDRVKASLASALTSTFTLGLVLLLVVIFGVVCAQHW